MSESGFAIFSLYYGNEHRKGFLFMEKEYKIVGEKTGKTFRLGDRVKIKVAGVNMEEKKLRIQIVIFTIMIIILSNHLRKN